MTEFYFSKYEHRRPPPPLEYSRTVELIWQVLAIGTLISGSIYIHWRWTDSLNHNALWFALPLVIAETCALFGLFLFVANLWKVRDYERRPAPVSLADCTRPEEAVDRPIVVDVFIPTYNEEEELVRLTIRDAKAITYPHPVDIRVAVLDDGRRPTMRAIADEEGVAYYSRDNNAGFKAGNLRNAMEQTGGDFILILDADTRPFPPILENMLGYFRDPDVAMVQSPQWFYDLPEGRTLDVVWGKYAGGVGRAAARALQAVVGELRVGEDPFANDPAMFYDIIQRRRNPWNAAFCCGAGSLHRREAVMFVALREYTDAIAHSTRERRRGVDRLLRRGAPSDRAAAVWNAAQAQELTPYKFHVSEDIYSTIVLHQDRERGWKTVLHPQVESKMLSPQDLLTWTIQRFKYAGGSLDIFFHDNPIFRPGLRFGQRVMYLATFWSYFSALWNVVFLAAPIVYFVTGIPPVDTYTGAFFAHALPFLVINELAFMMGTWGLSGFKGKVTYLSTFPTSLKALWAVARGKEVKFHVTPKLRQEGNHLHLVWPQLAVIVLTILSLAWAVGNYALGRGNYSLGGVLVNGLWALNNAMAMYLMVAAAFWKPPEEEGESA